MDTNTLPPLPNPPTDDTAVQRAITLLTDGKLAETKGRLRWSSNYTFLVSICDSEYQTVAVYKPQKGERPLWDFPDGTLCYREQTAYWLSEALGWRIVPPTVLREGEHGLGSFQLFIEHDPEVNYFSLDDSYRDQLKKIAIFDFIANNADRKGGHILVDKHDKLWGIDHGICYHRAPKLRTVIWDFINEPIEDNILSAVAGIHTRLSDIESPLYQQFRTGLDEREVDMCLKRTQTLLQLKKFPEPRHGPNYPWPPV